MCLYRTLKQVDFHGDTSQFQASLDFDEGKILLNDFDLKILIFHIFITERLKYEYSVKLNKK